MNNTSDTRATPRNLWVRALLMILMGLAYQLAGSLLFFLGLIQFILALLNGAPNPRLMSFGSGLGRFQGQIANFISFASEEPPFPFSDWPAA
jgi:hypothetical protein